MGLVEMMFRRKALAGVLSNDQIARARYLIPSVVRMAIAGKEAGEQTDVLLVAAKQSKLFDGESDDTVRAMVSAMERRVRDAGEAESIAALRTSFGPDDRRAAVYLAMKAAALSMQYGSEDLGILSALADDLQVLEADFEAIVQAVKSELNAG